jgi:myo-inositol 2-dehydrogenase / D-chiro-inositol 1-dehydrogenase
MTLRIGLIGAGVMGSGHARMIQTAVHGAELSAIAEGDAARRQALAQELGLEDRGLDGFALIRDPSVDAVVIASPDDTHAALTLAAIEAGKPVLCEKPLGVTEAECRAIMAAETAAGRRLVQVGYMRRFDPGYVALRQAVVDRRYGAPLFFHCIHRNKVAPPWMTSDMILTNSVVHEIDIARFVLGEEYAGITVVSPRATSAAPARQPQLVVMETEGGVVVDVEAFVDAQYGYDVRGELVCESGTSSLAPSQPTTARFQGQDGVVIDPDWIGRFADAYRLMLNAFVAAAGEGRSAGASAFDGYQATRIATAALTARSERRRVAVAPEDRPAFYD